jgi:sensor c-di-GMP phosphodiesterase-like protein
MTTDAIDLAMIRSALETRSFFLLYQPIVSLRDGSCFGAEALIRWRRDDGATVEAAAFIPMTDHTPLSGTITYWVIDTVAAQLCGWLEDNADANISINVPPEILGRGGLEYAAKKSGLRARTKQLILEITERGIPDQLGLEALNNIPSTGARVALDDTTLSGANLALLTRCNFDFVKVDGQLLNELAPGKPRPPWMDGLAALLQTSSLQIIAEGVETVFQVDALRATGVQLAQGHYFSVPLSADDFMGYYASRRKVRFKGL